MAPGPVLNRPWLFPTLSGPILTPSWRISKRPDLFRPNPGEFPKARTSSDAVLPDFQPSGPVFFRPGPIPDRPRAFLTLPGPILTLPGPMLASPWGISCHPDLFFGRPDRSWTGPEPLRSSSDLFWSPPWTIADTPRAVRRRPGAWRRNQDRFFYLPGMQQGSAEPVVASLLPAGAPALDCADMIWRAMLRPDLFRMSPLCNTLMIQLCRPLIKKRITIRDFLWSGETGLPKNTTSDLFRL